MARKILQNRSNPRGGIDYNILMVIGLGYLAYRYNAAGIRDVLGGIGGGPGGVESVAGGGGGRAVSDAVIATWAAGIGLSANVGRLFVADRGRLPASIDELVAWGNARGYRLPNGGWVV